ncbi:MAG TPA: hypothetical protein GX507_05810 [Clostridia bacterium]|nr:hypothetical protein [Clostridia bacterium]
MAFYAVKRPVGEEVEQPYILGRLKLRIPFVHYPFEFPDAIQGAILSVVPMGAIAAMNQALGIPFEIAIGMVIVNNFLYLIHTHFGDPVVAGWITPGIPLYIAFVTSFAEGVARIHAMIALQAMIGIIFLVLGVTGLAKWVVDRVPVSMKAGIVLGAGFASILAEFSAKGRVSQFPVTILFGVLSAYFMLFSQTTNELRKKIPAFRYIAQYGIAVPFAIAYALGIAIGEVQAPQITWNLVPVKWGDTWRMLSPFVIGWPPLSYYIQAFPLAFAAYIIAFGDVLLADSLFKTADAARPDEKVIYEPNRNHIICAIRNLFECVWMPYLPLAGPQWVGGQALVINRYMNSTRQQEESYWGGATSIFWGMSIALCLGPIVSLFKPGVAVGLSLTVLIQGFLCCYVGMEMVSTTIERGVAGIIGAVIAGRGAAWGLAIGVALYLLVEYAWVKPKVASAARASSQEASGSSASGD